MNQLILDGHTHCGLTLRFEELSNEWRRASVDGGVVFSPVEEIYDRYSPSFFDSAEYRESRAAVHEYLLAISSAKRVFPYFFVWNDFVRVPEGFVGVKWHRHPGEPRYAYETPACLRLIDEICARRLPIVLEEEFSNTMNFLKTVSDRTVVIIPHMGALNGGYFGLKRAGIFESPSVWVDTALAGHAEIEDFAENYGVDRIIFGSDYPFGVPAHEKGKLREIFSGDDLSPVFSGNLLRLLGCGSDGDTRTL
jgi:predicted TIM-barrel fold metal-dependent hydrolase